MEPLVIRFEIGMSEALTQTLASIVGTIAAAQVMAKTVEAPASPKEEQVEVERPAAAPVAPAPAPRAEAPKAAPAKPSAVKEIPDSELTEAVDRAKARGITNTQLKALLAERGYARVLACPQDQREDFIMSIDNL